ncbi:SDR family oxidoreductase [Streptococcus sp. DD13]|uniref:SDR family oxidoreductase n=1 Tax=Streptococcus sp. DD13 TaxID=1777881 RepID=UPI00079666F9|nr:SDR family oxidoreductase [Streptococcus sp. DD13]KXT78316.1 Short chain dehydrogenase [Streptococcus sp. DD13]
MGETILVTGASSGFGRAICHRLVADGHRVIGAARRFDRLEEMREELGSHFYPLKMDVSDQQQVDQALDDLPAEWSEVDVLVNNAGLALGLDPAYQANPEDWQTMIATNIWGLIYLTHRLLPQMVERDSGYVINMGSTAGTVPYPGANVYGATKAFVKQFSLNLRADLAGKHIRVTTIEPGLCEGTEFSTVRFKGDQERVTSLYKGAQAIRPEDIAETIAWLIQQPKHLNINRIELMPVSQTFGPQPVFREEEKE